MRRTKVLLRIVFTLSLMIAIYLFYVDFDVIYKKVYKFIININRNEIVVPNYTKNHKSNKFIDLIETNDFEVKSKDDISSIYYTILNNGWNTFTFYCDLDYETCDDDIALYACNGCDISLLNSYVSPLNSYEKYNTLHISGGEYHISVERQYSEEETIEINNYVDKVLTELKIDLNSPTLDDIKKIHDYIIKNTTYDTDYNENKNNENNISSKATGIIKNKKAVCSGYTDLFSIFLDKLNIPNFKINNDSDHIWNAMYVNNKWVHVDLTWDDDEINKYNTSNFFAISTKKLLDLDSEKHTFDYEKYKEFKTQDN